MPPRKKLGIVNVQGDLGDMPGVMTEEQLQRKIDELSRKLGTNKKPIPKKALPPGGTPELWPGGPSTDTGDIAIV